MRITLRSIVLTLAVLATAAFTTKTASAAVATATVSVPFNFNINGKALPAGNYFVTRTSDGSFVTLQTEDRKQAYTWFAARNGETSPDPKVTLRFDESDGAYALRSVQYDKLMTARLDKNVSEVRAIHIVHGR
ncbi:hypothetical protein [Terracidiphilus sp.]|jgi:hypothetical protein|uniref:hypothetical protein n=1 Tax=Terracidiphilus sp. TaxID=1964191 RepID=UPI003C2981C1